MFPLITRLCSPCPSGWRGRLPLTTGEPPRVFPLVFVQGALLDCGRFLLPTLGMCWSPLSTGDCAGDCLLVPNVRQQIFHSCENFVLVFRGGKKYYQVMTRRKICHGSPDYFPLQFWTYFLHLNWPCWGMNFKAGHLLLALVRQDSLSPTTPHPTWACSSWLDLTHWLVFLSDSLRLRCSFTFTLGFSQSTEGNWAIAIWWCLPFPFVLCSPRASVLSAHSSALSWEFPLTFQILILHF